VPDLGEKLNDSEEVVLDLKPHWWFFAPQILAFVGLLVVAALVVIFTPPSPVQLVVAAVAVAWLVWFLARYLVWRSTNFFITTDRLINRTGLIRRQGIEIPLERVNTVFFSQTIFERMMGMGDLAIESAGEQGSQTIDNIARPLRVQNEIYRQMEGNENRKFDRVGRSELSIPEQIEKLAELHRDGVLTDAEFQDKKKELLDRL
jgi:uncharacterized membrane protein YdbT with pleckstrin-like domain